MEFTTEEKKKLNEFVDEYEYLLEEGDYVTFLRKYREQNKNVRDALYYAFVDLVKDSFGLNIEWFIKNDPYFKWTDYFESDYDITHINIPAGVTTIPNKAFYNCSKLKTVTFGEGSQLTSIGEGAFQYCSSLTSIYIPDSVTTIGDYAFHGCSNLKTVSISENSQLTSIGSEAFFYCSLLTSIYIPDNVTSIEYGVFGHCSNLKTVTIGENSQLTEIGYGAFNHCSSLTSIYIPDSVATIDSLVFFGCDNLTIYCEASSQPSGWNLNWNPSDCSVVWGYKKK